MRKELAKTYDPKSFEDRIYQFWMDGGYFTAERDPEKTPYTIVIPPPNITGQLHMGHALDETLQDILTAAVNEAIKTVTDTNNEEMGKVTGPLSGMGLPGML